MKVDAMTHEHEIRAMEEAHSRGEAVEMEQPEHFTCFHCWEQFDASTLEGQRAARDHFGWSIEAEPACMIKRDERQLVFRIRALEEQLQRYRDEDGPKDREIRALLCKHATELREAEERGFERGIADMREHGWCLKEELERPDLYPVT